MDTSHTVVIAIVIYQSVLVTSDSDRYLGNDVYVTARLERLFVGCRKTQILHTERWRNKCCYVYHRFQCTLAQIL